jgi:choline dehydrogenase
MAVPAAWPTLLGTSADWADDTAPQPWTGTRVSWPRGRGVGGSSAINGMNFIRGQRGSYDAWVTDGAKGWGFDDLLPYFKRSERALGRDPVIRGLSGPLTVTPAKVRHPIAEAGLAAAIEMGHSPAIDLSSGVEEGFGWCDLNIVAGQRQSAADAYLTPILRRPNLRIRTDALVHRMMIVGDRCTGVQYSIGSEIFSVGSSEVVLTAGTVGSAQMLMLSGIGPASHLRDVGVDVAMNVPGVGSNLHDHPMSGVVYRSAQPVPPGTNNHGEAMGLLRSKAEMATPDIQVMFVDVPLRADALPGPAPGEGYSLVVSLMLPHSRGSVRLVDATPGSSPLIDPGYYADPRDLDAMIAGLRATRTIGRAPSLAWWRDHEVLPGASVQDYASVRAYLRTNLRSYSHYGGTCRIGDADDGVVDLDLRVHGVNGLRVADASVMPAPISANTNATVYAIAERAAALIRG